MGVCGGSGVLALCFLDDFFFVLFFFVDFLGLCDLDFLIFSLAFCELPCSDSSGIVLSIFRFLLLLLLLYLKLLKSALFAPNSGDADKAVLPEYSDAVLCDPLPLLFLPLYSNYIYQYECKDIEYI